MKNGQNNEHRNLNKVSFAGLLIALGIVFRDIGTSPLSTFAAIVGEREITQTLALGALSAVFWTLTLQTTIKYISIVLSADNNGEGGVFSLYTLILEKAGNWKKKRYARFWRKLPNAPTLTGSCMSKPTTSRSR